jgi:hypothetical protein
MHSAQLCTALHLDAFERGLDAGFPVRISTKLVDIIPAVICSGGSITGDRHGLDCIDSPHARVWLANSSLAPHIDLLITHLEHGRYAIRTIKGYMAGVAHFARWMTQCDVPVQLLDECTVQEFLSKHLPCCTCPTPVMRVHDDIRAALGPACWLYFGNKV